MNPSPSFPAVTVADQVATAQGFVAAGRFDEAEALLTDLLQRHPNHADGLNALGGAALARKDLQRAHAVLAAAATAFPDHFGLVNNLGIAHQMAGRLDDAILCFERAAALAPELDAPLQALATARFLSKDFAGAGEAAARILARTPDAADAIGLLGLLALANSDGEEAERLLRRALVLKPGDAASLRALSLCCFERGGFEEALSLAERARLVAPLDVDVLEHLARCQAGIGDYRQAAATCRKLLAFAPNHLGIRETLARILILTGETDAGIAEMSRVVKANPGSAESLLVLAATLRFAGRAEQALPFLTHALKVDPGNANALRLESEIALALGRFPPRAVAEQPVSPRVFVPPMLMASEFVLFARFLPRLAREGRPVELIADERFLPLAGHLSAPIARAAPAPDELAIALPALMRCFDLDAATIGAGVPYMQPDPALDRRWRQAFEEYPRPWIGVIWEGQAAGLSMAQLRAAMPASGTAISLMTGQSRHDLAAWPEAIDAGRHMDDFGQMIAAIANLDIVVGPDVLALHLAGALGRAGLVAVPTGYPWYWAARAGRSLWYPSVDVLAQARPGDWSGVIAGLRERLSRGSEAESKLTN
ncbi:tetratricopeptide repeat protein [Bosea caraganae]|uniref:tetratricopeptide repeat protein n=1 Tax=Bosea caraganae TaxID=2763117 RepID=UPI0015F06C0E|nr:tetratricopeptide repeat protein [Bosea caraganae]